MIENKYVGCFLKIQDTHTNTYTWYAIMRLFGTTINTGFFALTEKNKAYYKIKYFDIEPDGSILLQNYSINPNTNTIKLDNNSVTNISKTSFEFGLLQNFRNQKIFANAEKKQLVQDGIFGVIKNVFFN